jgi:hypothetical protein
LAVLLRVVLLIFVITGGAGCAALPLGAVGAAAISGGASTVARAGTEVTLGGTARRTISLPADAVHDTALATLARIGIKVTGEERDEDGHTVLRGLAYDRSVAVRIEPVTPMMTRFGVTVRHGITRDGATASEILAQLERALDPHAARGSASP